MSNPFINNYSNLPEQTLTEDLIQEAISMHGVDMIFIPRTFVKQDLLFGEDILSKFEKTYDIEVYVATSDGFTGQGDVLAKFGLLEIRDQATFVISKRAFDQAVNGEYIRPREGDLIYFPFNKCLFEVKFVEHQKPFYQFGNLTHYEVNVELFQYSHEVIDTGITDIDETQSTFMYTIKLTTGTGTGTFLAEETAYQGNNINSFTAKGDVVSYDSGILTVQNIVGKFVTTSVVKGVTSSASRAVTAIEENEFPGDLMVDNKRIKDAAATIVDFTEDNPFSEDR